ncbi:MAG: electron transport protein [Bryobacteraceae bacterium]
MRRPLGWILPGLVLTALLACVLTFTGFRYAFEPGTENVLSRTRPSPEAYDLWGRTFTREQARELLQTPQGKAQLSPADGAVKVDDALLKLGRSSFYKETFGNEVFLTDVVGILDGPLRLNNVTKAILALRGGWTTNLRVEVPETVRIGDRTFQKGSYFDTGLDVPRGALLPLGMTVAVSQWRVRVGITCALCHATVDGQSGKVIEGAPNQDFAAGLLLALATNSAAYFMHTDVAPLQDAPPDASRTVIGPSGEREKLPAIAALETAVDKALLMWPRGNFDSLTDTKADPTQNPVSFTWGNHPYGWSGNFMAGPFRGLTSQNNNVHALNSDSLLLADSSPTLFDIDKEMYLAILLQNAANSRYRFDPSRPQRPSEFLAAMNGQEGSPGLNEVVLPPTYPKGTILSPDGTLTSAPGYRFWEQNNAIAAWQDTIVPPPSRVSIDAAVKDSGRQIFDQAGCSGCHAGPFLSNNSVVPSGDIGSNPARSLALAKTELNFTAPVIYTFDTPVPLPPHPQTLPVPTSSLDPKQVDLAWAHNG